MNELVHLLDIEPAMIAELISEASDAGEFVNVLWRLYEHEANEWRLEMLRSIDAGETLLAFISDEQFAGVARVTAEPKHVENGKVGFYIRPSWRGKHLASHMIKLIQAWCDVNEIDEVTAVVDITNTKSLKALHTSGWEKTGKSYKWKHGRTAIEMKPKRNDS